MKRWLLLAVPLLAGSCDDHLIGECDADAETLPATWAGVEDLFVQQCVVCHTASGPGGFDLSEAIENELADDDDSNNYYVIPGDPENSVLWQSLIWEGSIAPMPEGAQQPLSECAIGHVEAWIAAGATLSGGAR